MSVVHNLATAAGLALFLFGLFVFFSAVLGLFRFDYVLNRMHAAAVGDSLGIFCVLIGLMLLHGWSLSAGKTVLIFVFLWLTSPVSSHLIAEMEVMPDHVHLLLSIDPQLSIHRAIKRIKGRSSHDLREEFPWLKSRIPTLWTNSYFVSTVGGAPLAQVRKYIERQKEV